MYVGDGTWVSSENTFLLPNLQGLNFATMQYNSKLALSSSSMNISTILSIWQACRIGLHQFRNIID